MLIQWLKDKIQVLKDKYKYFRWEYLPDYHPILDCALL